MLSALLPALLWTSFGYMAFKYVPFLPQGADRPATLNGLSKHLQSKHDDAAKTNLEPLEAPKPDENPKEEAAKSRRKSESSPKEPRLADRKDVKPNAGPRVENLKPEPERDVAVVPVSKAELSLALENVSKSNSIVEQPKITLELWDLDLPERNYRLLETGYSRSFMKDFIRKEDYFIVFQAARVPEMAALIKPGHRLVGWVTATCRNCVRTRAYWIHMTLGQGGWLWEFPPGEYPQSYKIESLLPAIRENFEGMYFRNMSQDSRINMENR
jgi:hypothetical protein